MSDINLLPEDLKPKGYALKVSGVFKKLQIIAFSVLIISIVLVIAANVFLSLQSNRLTKRNEELKKEIEALSQTEQKLVLVEDRVKKIKNIESLDNTYDEASALQNILKDMPSEVTLKDYDVENGKSGLTVKASSSSDLTKYYTYILNSNTKKVDLTAFRYNKGDGYEVDLNMNN